MSKDLILAIESSCDETAIAVLENSNGVLQVLTNQVSSQVKLHAKWGGVVPNLAAREHVKNIPQVLKMALAEAKISPAQIDVIAVTSGPGLIPALMVGVGFAKTLAYLWGKPLIGIHHIEGHIYANFIGISNFKFQISKQDEKDSFSTQNSKECEIQFPALALVVSGGHTQLMLMQDHLKYEIIGQTVDDAVGEAFDKVARILGIGYPGGPAISAWAEIASSKSQVASSKNMQSSKSQTKNFQNLTANETKKLSPEKLTFPRPMLNKKNFNFSFSGLKTAVLYETKKHLARNASRSEADGSSTSFDKKYISEVCHEFQQACVDVLVAKTIRAAKQYAPKTILLAGGVSANTELRKQLGEAVSASIPDTCYMIPDTALTGDNAAMIGAAAAFRWEKMSDAQKKKAMSGWKTLQPDANLKLK